MKKLKKKDEFLSKKQPLILPPNYEKKPEPGSLKNQAEDLEK
ncbi:MAG: hypothetical protein CM15mV145_010 [uncultured marine virus]|nr:MAG: hypothetical protein CM15mV145_010 [uncultured marine virus]